VFVPWFNCGQPTSFTTDIVVTPDGEALDEVVIPVDGNVQ
jgi:hypothetical protein